MKNHLILSGFMLVFGGCTFIEMRQPSAPPEGALPQDEENCYFMYPATKTDIERIGGLFNHPPLKTRYDTHGNDWQLKGAMSVPNLPLSAVLETFTLPYDYHTWSESLPEKSIALVWGSAPIVKIRVFHLVNGAKENPETRIYGNRHEEVMALLTELLQTLPAEGDEVNINIGKIPQYRIELVDREGSCFALESFDEHIRPPSGDENCFYGKTYGRETTLRRLMYHIEEVPGTYDL